MGNSCLNSNRVDAVEDPPHNARTLAPISGICMLSVHTGKRFLVCGITNSMIKKAVTRYKTSLVIPGFMVPFGNNIQGRQPQLAPNVSWSIMNRA